MNILTYKLKIERSIVFYFAITDIKDIKEERRRLFTLISNCPIKNQKFKALIVLYDTEDSPIKSVKVEGVLE